MQLSKTELQEMIESSVLDYLDNEYDFIRREQSVSAENGINPAVWSSFAEMGWLGLPLKEENGGIDGGLLEAGLLMKAFGRHLVVEPVINSVFLGARLLEALAPPSLHEALIPSLMAGEQRVVLAHDEAGRDPWAERTTRVAAEGEGFRLSGVKTMVSGAPGAHAFVISALDESHQLRLFLVANDLEGLTIRPCRALHGGWAADLRFDGVFVAADAELGIGQEVESLLDGYLAQAFIMQCWEATGAMERALEQTAEYTGERQQFGQPLSKFQVVQHKLAEMAVSCEEARSACQFASLRTEKEPSLARQMAAMAKSKVARGARSVAQDAVQLHGGMGVSEELITASLFRKLLAFAQDGSSVSQSSRFYGTAMLKSAVWKESQVLPRQNTNLEANQ